jgi:hypothetical protein
MIINKKTINFAIKCIKQARFEDKQMNEMGDYPRNPPWSEGKKEYDDAIKELKQYKITTYEKNNETP